MICSKGHKETKMELKGNHFLCPKCFATKDVKPVIDYKKEYKELAIVVDRFLASFSSLIMDSEDLRKELDKHIGK